jgi:hypothetical protein
METRLLKEDIGLIYMKWVCFTSSADKFFPDMNDEIIRTLAVKRCQGGCFVNYAMAGLVGIS